MRPAEWEIQDVFLDLDHSKDLSTPNTQLRWGRCGGNAGKVLDGKMQLKLDMCRAA